MLKTRGFQLVSIVFLYVYHKQHSRGKNDYQNPLPTLTRAADIGDILRDHRITMVIGTPYSGQTTAPWETEIFVYGPMPGLFPGSTKKIEPWPIKLLPSKLAIRSRDIWRIVGCCWRAHPNSVAGGRAILESYSSGQVVSNVRYEEDGNSPANMPRYKRTRRCAKMDHCDIWSALTKLRRQVNQGKPMCECPSVEVSELDV